LLKDYLLKSNLFKFTPELGDLLTELLDKKKADALTLEESAELDAIGVLDTIVSYINAIITSQSRPFPALRRNL
jgi:hypothetical protein